MEVCKLGLKCDVYVSLNAKQKKKQVCLANEVAICWSLVLLNVRRFGV